MAGQWQQLTDFHAISDSFILNRFQQITTSPSIWVESTVTLFYQCLEVLVPQVRSDSFEEAFDRIPRHILN